MFLILFAHEIAHMKLSFVGMLQTCSANYRFFLSPYGYDNEPRRIFTLWFNKNLFEIILNLKFESKLWETLILMWIFCFNDSEKIKRFLFPEFHTTDSSLLFSLCSWVPSSSCQFCCLGYAREVPILSWRVGHCI